MAKKLFGFDYNSGQAMGIRGTAVKSSSAGADLVKSIRATGSYTIKKK